MTEIWKQIDGGPYEISNLGALRRTEQGGTYPAGFYLRPIRYRATTGYSLRINGRNIFVRLSTLMKQHHYGSEPLPMEELNQMRDERNMELRAKNGGPKRPRKQTTYLQACKGQSRRCTTCGKLTNNYRCADCWTAIRGEADTYYGEQDMSGYGSVAAGYKGGF